MAENITVLIIDADGDSRRASKGLMGDIGWVTIAGECEDPSQGLEMVRKIKPDVVFLNLYPEADQLLGLAEKIVRSAPRATLFVTSPDRNPDIIIKAMRSGAKEFLRQPYDRDELTGAFRKFRMSDHASADGVSHGRIISVFGMKGGVGATTIAINLAVNLARYTKRRVVLVDLNLQLGNAALFLNIKPKYSIVDIAGGIEEIDPVTVKGILPRHESGMYLLSGPPRPEQAELVRENHLDRILMVLRSMFDFVVIDTTNVLGELALRALDESEMILAVLTDDLAAIYNARQCLDIFDRMGYGEDKVRLVMNRGYSNRGISSQDVEKSIDYPVFWKIPNEKYPTVLSSLNQGIPISLFKPHSKLSGSFRDLANHLNSEFYPEEGRPAPKRKKGLAKRLFGG
ncbi:MAG: AAA family ATPase [bacterium]|jgi:pilus assembly protein CpaE